VHIRMPYRRAPASAPRGGEPPRETAQRKESGGVDGPALREAKTGVSHG